MPELSSFRLGRANRLRRLGANVVLWLHHEAERRDLVPCEFGDGEELDLADARAVAREWRRQLRLWAAYNPEEVLALKAGATALGLALVVLILIARAVN